MRQEHDNSKRNTDAQRGSSGLAVLTTIAVSLGAVQIMSSVQSYQAKNTTHLSHGVVAEHYGRLAIIKLKQLLDQGTLDIKVDDQSIQRPELSYSDPTREAVPAVWYVESPGPNGTFISHSCPSGLSTHLTPVGPGNPLAPPPMHYDATWRWSDTGCFERGVAVATRVRIVQLSNSRASVVVEATTDLLGTAHKLRAVLIVPQRLLCEAMQCNLAVSRQQALTNQTFDFTVTYAQHLTNEIRYRLRRLDGPAPGTIVSELMLTPATNTSTLTRSASIPTAGQYEIDVEVAGGGCPCSAQQPLQISAPSTPPPPINSCKWADPNYSEVTTWKVCSQALKAAPRVVEFEMRIGRSEGTSGAPGGCAQFGFPMDGCRYFPSVSPVRNLGTTSAAECRNLRGAHQMGGYGGKVLIGFSYPTDTYPNRKCGFTVVNVRNPSNGCLPPESMIRMDDGSLRSIRDIRVGDRVWNPRIGDSLPVKTVIAGPEAEPLVRLQVIDRTFLVTETHPMLTRRGLIQAQFVRTGDELYIDHETTTRIYRADRAPVDPEQMVFNLELDVPAELSDEGPYFEADGIVVGDYSLQVALNKPAFQVE